MREGQVSTVVAEAGYGFAAGADHMQAPAAAAAAGPLHALLRLRAVLPVKQVLAPAAAQRHGPAFSHGLQAAGWLVHSAGGAVTH